VHLGSILGSRAQIQLGLPGATDPELILGLASRPAMESQSGLGRALDSEADCSDDAESDTAGQHHESSRRRRRRKHEPHSNSTSPERTAEPLYATRLRQRNRRRGRANAPQGPEHTEHAIVRGHAVPAGESNLKPPELPRRSLSAVKTQRVSADTSTATVVYAGPAACTRSALRRAKIHMRERDGYQSDGAVMRLAERELGLFAARAGKHDPYRLHRSVGVYAARFASRSLRSQRLQSEHKAKQQRVMRVKRDQAAASNKQQNEQATRDPQGDKAIGGGGPSDDDEERWSVVSAPADEPVASLSGVRAVQAPFDASPRPFAGWLSERSVAALDGTRRLDLSGRERTDQ